MHGSTGESPVHYPVSNIALPFGVPSHADHGAIVFKPHRVLLACGDLSDVHPAADIAVPFVVRPSNCNHGAVGLESHRVSAACRDRGDVKAKNSLDGIVVIHSDVGGGNINISYSLHIATPVLKHTAFERLSNEIDYRASNVDKRALTRFAYLTTIGTGGVQTITLKWTILTIITSFDVVVVVHDDVGYGGIGIANAVHIASPLDKAVALFRHGHQVDHCSRGIGKSPLARFGYHPLPGGTGDGEFVLRRKGSETSSHPHN